MFKYNLRIFFSQVFHGCLLVFFFSPAIFESNFVLKSNKPLIVCFSISIFPFSRKNNSISKFSVLIMTFSKTGKHFFQLRDLLFRFCIFSLAFEKTFWAVVSLYWMLWITKCTALLHSNERKNVMTFFHQLQGSLVTYFNFFLFI